MFEFSFLLFENAKNTEHCNTFCIGFAKFTEQYHLLHPTLEDKRLTKYSFCVILRLRLRARGMPWAQDLCFSQRHSDTWSFCLFFYFLKRLFLRRTYELRSNLDFLLIQAAVICIKRFFSDR